MLLSKHFYRFLLLCVMILSGLLVQARHIKGGWMFYTHQGVDGSGNHIYRVTVRVYRDCEPPQLNQNDNSINITVFRNGTNTSAGNFAAPLVSSNTLSKSSYDPCINPQPQVCYVILEYQGTVTLPASTQGYTLAFQRCCRIDGIVNIQSPSNILGNTYTLSIPGNAANPQHVINNSPVFSMRDTLLVCYNSPIELDYSATDPDGDSLVYSFTPAINGGGQNDPAPSSASAPPYAPLTYRAGFSPTNPFGTNVQINARTGVITGTSPGVTGEYVLSVEIAEYRNGVLIASTRKELHVNVAACSIAAADLPIRIMSCDGYTVQFENLSTSPAILSYYWDFGVTNQTNDTSIAARPTFTFPDTGIYIAKLIINKRESCSDSATTEVRVYPGFNPSFTTDGSCFSNPFNFLDASTTRYGFVNSWRWNFGNPAVTNDTSRLRNASYTFPSAGTYNVSLEVTSNLGCTDSVVIPVTAFDRPALSITRDTLICSIDTLRMNPIGTGVFTWDPSPSLINGNNRDALVFPKDTTTYYINLNDRGCIARDSITVNVLDFITVNAGPDTTICRTDGIVLNPSTQALSFNWQPAALFDNNTLKRATVTPVDSITTVYITANLGKCQDRDSLTIKTVPYPQANAGPDQTICFQADYQLQGNVVASAYNWTPSSLVVNPRALITRTRSLTQTTAFVLTATDTLGCPKPVTDTLLITVRPRINVFAGNDTSAVVGQPLQFVSTSNATLFTWTPGRGLNNRSMLNPVGLYTLDTLLPGQETIRYVLTASTPEGCTASDDIVVRIFKTGPSIFVPNGFTPNGDGLNDLIRPTLAGMQRMNFFRIYNRYGQLVYETNRIGAGWDGRIKGNLQASNAYVYQCQAVDYTGQTVTAKGSFVLVR
ncbi:PKD domain-containing protein [Phnomibacter sp. MR]|uniref:PKD domain-containing protein n=1 Tax=Phnomibacter sp. MR TaxID=3042318 RepID=UPI003A801863